MKRPRVAIVAHEVAGQQGSERVIRELIRRAHEEIDITVVSRALDPELRNVVEWRRAPAPDRPYKLKFLTFFVTGSIQLLRARVDLVNVHAIGPTVANRADLTSVHLCREVLFEAFGALSPEVPVRKRVSPRLHVALERWTYRRSRMLAALSRGSQRELERLYPRARVVVTPNAVDVDRFRADAGVRAEIRSRHGAVESDVVALFVANAWHRKGLGVAIEGLGLAARAGAAPDWLWVVGYGDAARYAELAREHGVGARVRFLGAQARVEDFYRAADFFVLPSFNEELSLAALEAAASGLPVVATAVSGMEEVVGAGEAGLIVEREPHAFADALGRLTRDPELRARLGEAARRRASEFTWERSVASVLAAYRELLAGATARPRGRARLAALARAARRAALRLR
jgi:glycosyltransferase involved in cell wall biosynthesis